MLRLDVVRKVSKNFWQQRSQRDNNTCRHLITRVLPYFCNLLLLRNLNALLNPSKQKNKAAGPGVIIRKKNKKKEEEEEGKKIK